MRNIYLIARREYLERIRTRAFAVMTILVPAILFGITVVPSLLADRPSGTKHIAVVASDMESAHLIANNLQRAREQESEQRQAEKKQGSLAKRRAPGIPAYNVDPDTDTSAAHRVALTEKVREKQLDGVIWAPADALAARKVDYITGDTAILLEKVQVENSVDEAHQQLQLKKIGMSDAQIEDLNKPVKLQVQGTSGCAP